MSLFDQLKGTGVALVTPFKANGSIDENSYKKLLDFVIEQGCSYVVVLGTTGEAPVLDKEEKIHLIKKTYDLVLNRVPVVVGVGGNHTKAIIDELKSFPLDHTTAILSVSPYYSKPTQEGIFQHYLALAEFSPKPILLYNVPGRTGRGMTAETILRLAEQVPNIAGIKDASGDMQMAAELLKYRPESFSVISGDDQLTLAQMAAGMDGVISVVANAFPKAFSSMVAAAQQQDFDTARRLNDELLEVYELLFCENNPAGIKAFLSEMQLIENYLRLPLLPLSSEVHLKVKSFLKSYQQPFALI
jgi:4-hydroxy-tetrahydrodipicolinate synthase